MHASKGRRGNTTEELKHDTRKVVHNRGTRNTETDKEGKSKQRIKQKIKPS